eukprot:GHRR01031486.1.p1 GENE.GHRR01031486.1~~GHRR01031486.1.p1  ORF type:complete len:516 (+),score=198.60 GHRR01031486.1:1276-2823(+)
MSPEGATDPDEEFLDALSSDGEHDPADSSGQQQRVASCKAAGSASPKAADGAAVPAVFNTESYLEAFSEEPVAGTTWLPAANAEPQLPTSFLHGPSVAACLDRHEVKGEDKGLKVLGATWTPAGGSAAASFSAFGIFDGHGGKPAATFASKELLPTVMRLLDRCKDGNNTGSSSASKLVATLVGAEGEQTHEVEVTEDDVAVWAAQQALVDRLPKAMFAGFLEADKICKARHKVSGTTATLAVAVGWELLVANVGDSAAYLDTGKEVLALSGNHRLDENPSEKIRVIAAGGEVAKSSADGVPVGPNRVWPGGLAMSRTIGDPQAPQVIAVPEIRHVTLPTTGGRLVIASDGVWDHMQPKSIIHQVRNDNTDAAAKKISYAALKKKGLRDDMSVLVVDFMPQAGDPRPPALLPGRTTTQSYCCNKVFVTLQLALGWVMLAMDPLPQAGDTPLSRLLLVDTVSQNSCTHVSIQDVCACACAGGGLLAQTGNPGLLALLGARSVNRARWHEHLSCYFG